MARPWKIQARLPEPEDSDGGGQIGIANSQDGGVGPARRIFGTPDFVLFEWE
jgi:hypothetical protein